MGRMCGRFARYDSSAGYSYNATEVVLIAIYSKATVELDVVENTCTCSQYCGLVIIRARMSFGSLTHSTIAECGAFGFDPAVCAARLRISG
jgi:hypothetical protein